MRLSRLWRKSDRERDLEEEIESHLRMAEQDRTVVGEDAVRAKESARREFGNVGLVKEVTREMWGKTSIERLWQDVRYGLRAMGRSPGFAAVAIFSIALGIGANTAIFSLIDAIMLKPLPVRNPGELVTVGDATRTGALSNGTGGRTDLFSYPFFERFRERNQAFTEIYGRSRIARLETALAGGSGGGSLGETRCRFVTGNYFSVLGIQAAAGRTFDDAKTRIPGSSPVAVISDGFWERQFARRPAALGQQLVISGSKFTIIGVTPRGFSGETVGAPADVWLPATMVAQAMPGHEDLKDPLTYWLLLMGRLKPGVTLAQARASVQVLSRQLLTELYQGNSPRAELERTLKDEVEVAPGAKGFSRIRHDFSVPLLLLMGTVGLVLLICCANVANLQLARAASRRREMSLRLAVGAGRLRLLRQLLTESLLLAVAGGALALVVANAAARVLLSLISDSDQLPVEVHLDGMVLLFTGGVAVVAGLLFGLTPAWQSARIDLVSGLRESKSGQSQGFSKLLGKALIVSQIVFSVVLLVGAGSFLHTLQNLRHADVGYQRSGLLLAEIDPRTAGYSGTSLDQLSLRLLERLREIPGVAAVTVSENGLFSGTDSQSDAVIEGYTPHSEEGRSNRSDRVGPDYFQVVGTRVVAGRGIERQDVANAPKVAVINEKMARFYFPDTSPIGRHIIDGSGASKVVYTIVGVVQDVKEGDLRKPTPKRFYLSYLQHDDAIDAVNFEIRTRLASAKMIESVRRAIRQADAHLPILSLAVADSLIDDTLMQEKLVAKLSGFFALLALTLAAIGLYGVMSYLTARRTAEIGIRMALGAERSAVTGMVLKETFRCVAMGLAIGIAASLAMTRLLSNFLFGLSSFDPLTVFGAAGVVVVAALLAGYLPAWRAARVDPTIALRYE